MSETRVLPGIFHLLEERFPIPAHVPCFEPTLAFHPLKTTRTPLSRISVNHWLVFAIAAASLPGIAGVGFWFGLRWHRAKDEARSAFTNMILRLPIAVAITLIADLDRPRGGLSDISQQPLPDLKQALQSN